jgi:hypothetical protein
VSTREEKEGIVCVSGRRKKVKEEEYAPYLHSILVSDHNIENEINSEGNCIRVHVVAGG